VSALTPPPGDESVPELAQLVAEEIERHGPISFARFMQLVIAHPEYGYYATSSERPGYGGDFLTAPETHPIFGSVLARQVLEMWTHLGSPPELTLREYGAGRGLLARQIMAAISASGQAGLERVRYQLIDLARDEDGPEEDFGPFEGVVIANEFLDALPFHRLIAEGGELREIYTTLRDGWFADETGPLSPALAELGREDLRLQEGQRIEVAPQQVAWLRELADDLRRGFAILIDYGYPRSELHDPERFPNGTLKTYRAHEVGENPYVHLGRQDITAHVDFTAVEAAAREAGFTVLGLTTQAEFVAGLGIERDLVEVLELARNPDEYLAARAAVMELLAPRGLGRFRVLVLAREIDPDIRLRGLSFQLRGSGGPRSV